MSRRSSIATHPKADVILTAIIAGEQQKAIAARFNVTASAVSRLAKHVRNAAQGKARNLERQGIDQAMSNKLTQACSEIRQVAKEASTSELLEAKYERDLKMAEMAIEQADVGDYAKVSAVQNNALRLRAQLRGEIEVPATNQGVLVLMPWMLAADAPSVPLVDSQRVDSEGAIDVVCESSIGATDGADQD